VDRRRGYSLVEISVVAFILAVLLAVGIPTFTSYKAKQSCLRAAEVIMADLKLCQERAIALDASRSTGVATGIMPSSGYEYDVYEVQLDASFAASGIKAVRHVKLTDKGSAASMALVPSSGFSPLVIDFYRRPEQDWAGRIIVACGSHYCTIYVGRTGPGLIDMEKNF
jgi:prepilin-type N-terminal cleavage/methylation domain-containing protein